MMAFGKRETILLLVGDFLVLVASLWAALALRNLAFPSGSYFEQNLVPFLPVFFISLVIFYIAGLYEKPTRLIRRVMGTRILGALSATVAIAAILFFVFPFSIAPKTILVLYLIASVLAMSVWRLYRTNHETQTKDRARAVLVGSGAAVDELYEEVQDNRKYRFHFTAQIAPADNGAALQKDIEAALTPDTRILVLAIDDPALSEVLPELYRRMAARDVVLVDFVELYEEIFGRVPLESLSNPRVLELFPRQRSLYDMMKRLGDVVFALIVGVIALPFVLLAALPLLPSGTPFIRHERVGKRGQVFRIIKMRTMLFNDHGDPELRAKNRVTGFGRLLRKTRIDELPQLWNVLVGDLSFIGPRPELPSIAETYEKEIPYYQMRHAIVPGLSGWAQVNDYDAPRGGADVPRTRRKLSYDLYYLKHRSLTIDFAIAMKTLRALVALSGT